jgi:hypothetical protein
MRVAVRLKKPAAGFPARALFFDCEIMQVFCPTGQELFLRAAAGLAASAFYSNP